MQNCSFMHGYFSRILQLGTDPNLFEGTNISRGCPHISHLLFADDALFFLTVIRDSCAQVSKTIKRFCHFVESNNRTYKNRILRLVLIPAEEHFAFKEILRIHMVTTLYLHLGVSIDLTRKKCTHF